MQVTLYRLRHTYIHMFTCECMYICVYVSTTDEKRGQEFYREQERIYERVWREEQEGGNGVIIL